MSVFKKASDEKNVLNIIIVGCGNVGTNITDRLSREGHHITVIDKDPETVKRVSETYDVMGIVGNGSSYSIQLEAGIETADLIIAVTPSDELNLLCCTMAKKVGNCASIARVRTPDYNDELGFIRERLELSMIINPELESANTMARLLRLPGAVSINSFAKSHAELVKFKVSPSSPLCGKAIMNLQELLSGDLLICAVERGEELIIPNGSFVFNEGDEVSFVATAKYAQRFFKKISVDTKKVASALIVGGGRTAFYLSKQLLDAGIKVTLIERREDRCNQLAELLDGALILLGDGTDEKLLAEAGLLQTDAFIPLTNIDEENILLTLYAKKATNAKIITKIDRTNFHDVISGLDLDSVIYPKHITTESIIKYARGKQNSTGSNIETLYHLFNNRAEAIEFIVKTESAVTNTPIMNMHLKRDLLIASISRNGKFHIPSGGDKLMVGDTVVVITKHSGFDSINDILA